MAKGDPSGQGLGYFPRLYQSAVEQTGQDYDSIMGQYKNLASSSSRTPTEKLNFSPITPQLSQYQPGSDYAQLRDIASTGGFSEADIGNIRARGVAPIRSIYDSAQRGLSRQKSLQGGYSPNFGAASAKMARESSNLIANKNIDVNASIAEMVQRGKLAGATSLAPIEARENELRNSIAQANAATTNRANEFNAQMPLSYGQFNAQQTDNSFDRILESIKGQQSLYGTTPALANTFGNQVLNAANTVNSLPPIKSGSVGSSGMTSVAPYNPYQRGGMPGFAAGINRARLG